MNSPHITQAAQMSSQNHFSLMPLLMPLAQAKEWLIGVPAFVCICVMCYAYFSAPYYRALTRILPPQYNQNTIQKGTMHLGGESVLGNSALNLKNPTDLFVGILRSRTILDAVITRNELLKHYQFNDLEKARQQLETLTRIDSGKDGIVEISVEDTQPERAAQLANAYVAELQAFSAELAKLEGQRRGDFYNKALNQAKAKLNEADEQLREVEQRTGFTRLKGQDEAILGAVKELEIQLANKEVELRTLLSYATEANPDVQLTRAEIANFKQKIQEAAGQKKITKSNAPNVQPFVSLAQAPDALMEHNQRKREVAYWENIVNILGQYAELGKMDETRDFSLFQVLDEALPPNKKSRPRNLFNLIIYGTGSLLLTIFGIWGHTYIKQRIHSSNSFAAQWGLLKNELKRKPWHKKKPSNA
jgi:tyrosine-protein kinase Etk/Wzc